MSFNVYLQRAMRSADPVLRNGGKAVGGVVGYADRLLGNSARKVRTQLDTVSKLRNNNSKYNATFSDPRFESKLKGRADLLTSQSKSTRIKTGLTIGGAALAHKALSNYNSTPNYSQSNYQQYY